jgi:hypothetical protein
MVPVDFSVVVLTTPTLLLTESKASKVARLEVIAISPGEPPALIPPLASTSTEPLMSKSPGSEVGLDTPCEARTRVVSPLGGL